jgi:hypothetical protein
MTTMDTTEFKMPTHQEMDRITRHAHALRAQFLAAWIGKAIGWMARPSFRRHHA